MKINKMDDIKTLVLLKYLIPVDYLEYGNVVRSYPEGVEWSVSGKWIKYCRENATLPGYSGRWKIFQNLLIESLCECELNNG